MLPRPYRADRKLLEKIFSKEGRQHFPSRRATGRFCLLTIIKTEGKSPKTAFVVSSASAPLAVDRNRIKRRARVIVYKRHKSLPPGLVFMFVFNKQAKVASFEDLESDILNLLSPYFSTTYNLQPTT